MARDLVATIGQDCGMSDEAPLNDWDQWADLAGPILLGRLIMLPSGTTAPAPWSNAVHIELSNFSSIKPTTTSLFSGTRQLAAVGSRIDMNACATLSPADAALVLGIHRSTASELYRRGEFPVPVLQIGHRCRVTKIHLERFLLTGTAEATGLD